MLSDHIYFEYPTINNSILDTQTYEVMAYYHLLLGSRNDIADAIKLWLVFPMRIYGTDSFACRGE
jgi:hypothetical protein